MTEEKEKPKTAKKFCLVTGSNKLDGLGFALVVTLCKRLNLDETDVYLSGRKMSQLLIAQKNIKENHNFEVKVLELDFSNKESCDKLVKHVTSNYKGVDYWIHNADAFPPDMGDNKCTYKDVERFLNISNVGTQTLIGSIYPLFTSDSRLIIISSGMGLLSKIKINKTAVNKLVNPNLTLEELNEIVKVFVNDFKDNKMTENWGIKITNIIGKICRNCIARFYNIKSIKDKKGLMATSVCPGWVATGGVKDILDNNPELKKIAKQPLEAAKFVIDVLLTDKKEEFGGKLIQYGKDLQFDKIEN